MKSLKDIKKLIETFNVKPRSEMKSSVLDEALQIQRNKTQQNNSDTHTWRIIMKTKTAKLAVAAIFAISILLSITVFDKSVSQAFAINDIIEAMNASQWMHLTIEVTQVDADPDTVKRTKGTNEMWSSANPDRMVIKHPDGSVKYAELDMGKHSEYDPQTNVITTKLRSPAKGEQSMINMGQMLVKQIEQLKEQGASVTYSDDIYKGSTAKIINVDYTAPAPQNVHIIMSLWVEPETNLPLKLTSQQSTEQVSGATMTGTFSYPDSGPTDIYQVGVPRDAEIKIIDNRPEPDMVETLKPYNAARDSVVDNYIMVVTYANNAKKIDRVTAIYNDGSKQRYENHFVFGPGDAMYKMWPVYAAEMGDSFDSLLEWIQQNRSSQAWIYLYDGEYAYKSHRDATGKWTEKDEQHWPGRNPNPSSDLDGLGWSFIGTNAKMVNNNYSRTNNLICIETNNKAQIENGKLRFPAEKRLYYIDPLHGYMCIRKDSFWNNSSRQHMPDVDQLDFDPEVIPSRPSSRVETTEFTQDEAGRWYPARIEHTSIKYDDQGNELPSRLNSIQNIHLLITPEFPEGIFEPENIISKDTQPGIKRAKQMYQDAFDLAISQIDAQPDWPEPAQLAADYWNARADKDYSKCATLWPGSVTWNEKLLADEQPTEYVFGQLNQSSENYITIPDASKTYYEEHHDYNLKMHLTNEKSKKGRFYIISAN